MPYNQPVQEFSCHNSACELCGGTFRPTPRPNPLADIDFSTDVRPRPVTLAERQTINTHLDFATADSDETRIPARRNCDCEPCKYNRNEPSDVRESVVQSYSYEPREWTLKSLPGDIYNYHLGVELETDRRRTGGVSLSNGIAASLKRPARFWIAKHDGSVTGPEFASYPATLSWWNEHISDFADMFKMLLHSGYRSHEGGAAGMHVNISKTAFDDGNHLGRFMRMIYYSANWSLIMSQRTSHQAQQWAGLTGEYPDDAAVFTRARQVMGGQSYYSNRYTALNTPNGEQRLEFRLPRGTLRIDRFFKNLEWTAGMVEYTRAITDIGDITPERFMSWVGDNVTRWPNLFSYLNEKSEGLLLAANDRSLG
jgi:hypothetical protein